jgi:sulfite exporter TauE/SafE
MDWTLISSALIFGVAGNLLHCGGMCGPIIMALPQRSDYFYTGLALYHAGRILTYILIGLIVGLIGESLGVAFSQQTVSILGGVIIILLTLESLWVKSKSLKLLEKLPFFTKFWGFVFRQKSVGYSLLLGALNGLLPCGLVYIAATAAFAAGNYWNGGIYMFFFGLGTAPALVFIAIARKKLLWKSGARWLPAFSLLVASLLIVRGLNLGIPYLSPQLYETAETNVMPVKPRCH